MFATISKVETESYFVIGQRDFIANRGFHRDYDKWDIASQSEYEQGRLSMAMIRKVNTATPELAVA